MSLVGQQEVDLSNYNIFLFQDGGLNPHSGKRYAEETDIDENVATFQRLLPFGIVNRSECNLGVALNFERAENLVFGSLGSPIAYFFEDDLELGPYYLKTMNKLADLALTQSSVGYFTAYGEHRLSLAQQTSNASVVMGMGHNWAFGLTRSQWEKSAPYVAQYLQLVRHIDYRFRSDSDVAKLFHSWGLGAPGSSQDVAKTLACYATGGVKINTCAVFGRYIGEIGLHTNPEMFTKLGYRETQVMNHDVFHLGKIDESVVATVREGLRRYCMAEVIGKKVEKKPEKKEIGVGLLLETVKHQMPEVGELNLVLDGNATDPFTSSLRRGVLPNLAVSHLKAKMAMTRRQLKLADFGANVGIVSLPAAMLGAKVLAVEGLASNIVLLQSAIRANGLQGRITPVLMAAYDKTSLLLMSGSSAFGGVDLSQTKGSIVPSDTLVNILDTFNFSDADIIKIDIEGAELAALVDFPHFARTSEADLVVESNTHTSSRFGYAVQELWSVFERCNLRVFSTIEGALVRMRPGLPQPSIVMDMLVTRMSDHELGRLGYSIRELTDNDFWVASSAAVSSLNLHKAQHILRQEEFLSAPMKIDQRWSAIKKSAENAAGL